MIHLSDNERKILKDYIKLTLSCIETDKNSIFGDSEHIKSMVLKRNSCDYHLYN
jgi:hypothetical protein